MNIPKSWRRGGFRYHLVAEFCDVDVPLVTYKHWLKSKQCWRYITEERALLEWKLQQSNL